MKVRAASTSLPTLFPSPTGSRLSPSSSHRAIHEMAQTGRSNVRRVDPQRRYTVVLGPSWNAPIGALPHDDRAGTHDSADGQCGSYASTGHGQAATNIFRRYPQRVCQGLLRCGISSRLLTVVGQNENRRFSGLCQLQSPTADIECDGRCPLGGLRNARLIRNRAARARCACRRRAAQPRAADAVASP